MRPPKIDFRFLFYTPKTYILLFTRQKLFSLHSNYFLLISIVPILRKNLIYAIVVYNNYYIICQVINLPKI